MEDNTYTTNKLYQKLYQLNVIHDMDHDFSTTKFESRLAKIGKRIHQTAKNIYPQGGGDGEEADLIRNNALRNEDFVTIFIESKKTELEAELQGPESLDEKLIINLLQTERQYTYDLFNTGINRKNDDDYDEGDILVDRLTISLSPAKSTRSNVLNYSKLIINCNDFIDFHILNNIDLYAKIENKPVTISSSRGGDATLVAKRPIGEPNLFSTQNQGAKMMSTEHLKKYMTPSNPVKKEVWYDDTDSDSDIEESVSEPATSQQVDNTSLSVTDNTILDSTMDQQDLSLKDKKLMSVMNVVNYNITKTKGNPNLKLLNEYYRMQLNIIITMSAINYTDDVFSLLSSNEYRSISFLSVLYLFYSQEASFTGFKEVLNGIYINPTIDLSKNKKGGDKLTQEEINYISNNWLGIKITEDYEEEPVDTIQYKNGKTQFDDKVGEFSSEILKKNIDNDTDYISIIQYIKFKCRGSMNNIIAVLQYMTDGEFYTDKTIISKEKKMKGGKIDPSKLKILDRLVYKLNKIKQIMNNDTYSIDDDKWMECVDLYNRILIIFKVIVDAIDNTNIDNSIKYNRYYNTGKRKDKRSVFGRSTFTERLIDDFYNGVILGGKSAWEEKILGFDILPGDKDNNKAFILAATFPSTLSKIRKVTDNMIIPGVGQTDKLKDRSYQGNKGNLDELNNSPLCHQNWVGFIQQNSSWIMIGSESINIKKEENEELLRKSIYEDGKGFIWPGIALTDVDAYKMQYQLQFRSVPRMLPETLRDQAKRRARSEMGVRKINNLIIGIQKLFYEKIYQNITNRYNDCKYELKKQLVLAQKLKEKQVAEQKRLEKLANQFEDGTSLSPEGKVLANNVTTLITRGGLISTGVCTMDDGSPKLSDWAKECIGLAVEEKDYMKTKKLDMKKKENLFKSLIGLEIYCLWSFAFPDTPDFFTDKSYSEIRRKMPGSGTLDDRLLTGTVSILNDYFNDSDQNILGMFLTKKKTEDKTKEMKRVTSGKKWIINNASQMEYVNNQLVHRDNTVCVIPSIADGMSQCYSYDSAGKGSRYIYNMAYTLQNTDQDEYYEGIVKLDNNKGSVVKYSGTVSFANHKGTNMMINPDNIDTFYLNLKLNLNNGTDLEANEVYKIMLNKLELIFKDYYSHDQEYSIEELWGYMAEDRSEGSKFMEFMEIMMRKGCGDIFQEATSTLKNGAKKDDDAKFSSPNPDSKILTNWDKNGNMIRLGAMGDQPSGFRPAMINLLSNLNLWNKRVNTKNLSGYITTDDEKSLMIAAVGTQEQGGGRRKNKTRKHRHSRSNKKVKKSGSRKRRTKRNNH